MPHATDAETERAIERWFLARGTPHFIDSYSAAEDIFTRALPWLTIVFLLECTAALSSEWTWWQNTLAALGGFALLLGIWAGVNRARGQPALARPARVGRVELGVFVFGPALVTAVFGQPRQSLVLAGANVVLLGALYVVTSYGIVPLVRWATARMFRELAELIGLLGRALPMLLLFSTFLFINTEVWQVGSAIEAEFLAATVVLFVVLGTLFLVTRLPTEIERLAQFDDDTEIDRLCAGTPAEALAASVPDLDQVPLGLGRRQQANVYLVVLISEGIQIVAVTLLMFGFFIGFGLVAIRPDVIAAWVGDAALAEDVARFTFAGHEVILTATLLRVAGFLAAFSGFYFTVYAVTDSTYREQFFDDVVAELRQTFAVRAAYLARR